MRKAHWLFVAGWIIFVIGALEVVQGVWRQPSELAPVASSESAADTEAIEITLTDEVTKAPLRVRIPRSYLTNANTWRGGEQSLVAIDTRLPEMKPVTSDPPVLGEPGTPIYSSSLAEFNNGVDIKLDKAHVGLKDARERILDHLTSRKRGAGALKTYNLTDDRYFGLQRYKEVNCTETLPISCSDTFNEEFLSKDPANPPVHIICRLEAAPQINFRQVCEAQTSYRDHSLSYVFRYSQLSRWQEFDAAVRGLLDGFVVSTAARL
jgi:hypothetical protein